MSISRRTAIGLVAALAGGAALGTAALAHGHRGPWGREAMLARVASSLIDEALDRAQVTDEQRQAVHAARDRALAAIRAERGAWHEHLERTLALFEADELDEAQIAALDQEARVRRQRIADAIHQAIRDVHAVLTPEQRRIVADSLRDFRGFRH